MKQLRVNKLIKETLEWSNLVNLGSSK